MRSNIFPLGREAYKRGSVIAISDHWRGASRLIYSKILKQKSRYLSLYQPNLIKSAHFTDCDKHLIDMFIRVGVIISVLSVLPLHSTAGMLVITYKMKILNPVHVKHDHCASYHSNYIVGFYIVLIKLILA